MKKTFLVLSILSIPLGFAARHTATCQIPNGGFESWSGGDPPPWTTSNFPEAAPTAVNVTQTPIVREGSSALRGVVTTASDTFGGSFDHYPGLYAGDDAVGFPIASRPQALRGYWMYQPVGEAGSLGISVYLFKGEERTTVGYASAGRFASVPDTAYEEFLAPINWLTNDIPDTYYISAGISYGEVGSAFYLDDLSFTYHLEVLEPAAGDVLICGERDTVRWNLPTPSVDIYYSLDSGGTYTQIVSNHPGNSQFFAWDVPDSMLSTKAMVKIVNSADPQDTATSGRFYVKPWQLTRLDAAGNFELFVPARHGWSIPNDSGSVWPSGWWGQFDYQAGNDPNTGEVYPAISPFTTARPEDFPDWPLFSEVFGVDQCYLGDTTSPTVHSAVALTMWRNIKESWGGSCYGFAISGLLAFYHQPSLTARFPGIGGFSELYDVGIDDATRGVINHYFLHQFGDPHRSFANARWNTQTADTTLHLLKVMLSQVEGDAGSMEFYNNLGSGGHAVVPYRMTRTAGPTEFELRLYDSNNPGMTNRGILFDSAAGTWTEKTGLGWGTGSTGCIVGLQSALYFDTPEMSFAPITRPRLRASLRVEPSTVEVYNSPGAAIRIAGTSGDSVGYQDSVVFNTLSGAVPVIPMTGRPHPPIGYVLPAGDYAVEMGGDPESAAYISIMTDSLIYNYSREDSGNAVTDALTYSEGLGMRNPGATSKTVRLETIIPVDGTERILILSNLTIPPGDSLAVEDLDQGGLLTKNLGAATQYDLEVRHATGTGMVRFFHASLPIDATSSHHILPAWGDVGSDPVKILIDAGNDGSIDDSVFVSNELTEVEHRVASAIPAEYRLVQNYPNPFNPATTIEFDLPEMALVSLKVYNLVGEEVATLVEGVRQAGTYRARFDGSGLPSGVYIYRLAAGTFSAGGKMVLLR